MSGEAFTRAHDETAEALGAYVLGALPDDEAARVQAHLGECERCQEDLAALRLAVDALPRAAPPVQAPPALKERVMSVVRAEAELLQAAGEGADRAPAPPPRRRGLGALLARPAFAAAAAAGLAIAAIVGFVIGGGADNGGSTRTVQARVLSVAGAGPTTSAALRVQDHRATLMVRDMPEPPARKVYEVWVKHGAGAPVPAGTTFVVRSGDIPIAHTVKPGDQVLVTAEPGGGSPAPTSPPMIVARPA
ncbi:MAG TPA: anti-sigma factor [Solirubrobacteraceae bacterium]|nr:anti-sigma factor [Solirubrobacteraceae bacterium]